MLGRKETESLNETLEYRDSDTDKYLLLFDTMLEWNGSKKDWKRQFNAVVPKSRFTEYSDAAEFSLVRDLRKSPSGVRTSILSCALDTTSLVVRKSSYSGS